MSQLGLALVVDERVDRPPRRRCTSWRVTAFAARIALERYTPPRAHSLRGWAVGDAGHVHRTGRPLGPPPAPSDAQILASVRAAQVALEALDLPPEGRARALALLARQTRQTALFEEGPV